MKRVLFISSLFPPGGGPGAKRIVQLIKYLEPIGWNSIVLTHSNIFMGYDEKSLEYIPKSTIVCRTKSLEKYIRTKNNFNETTNEKGTNNHKNNNLIRSIVRFLKDNFGAPDTGVLWLPHAILSSIKIYKTYPYNAIFATGPPFSSLLIGLLIKKITKKPLIADFRDAYVANPGIANQSRCKLLFQRLYEKIVVCNAKYVIANTVGVQNDFVYRYPYEENSKFVVLPNGYDKDDLIKIKQPKLFLDRTKFNIVHTGTLSNYRSPKFFLTAIKDLIEEKRISREKVRVHLVGMINKLYDDFNIIDFIDKHNLSEIISMTGFISREDAFGYNLEADVLLLIIGIVPDKYLSTYGLSGKVYDYIITEKPILALAQEGGATYGLLERYKIGLIANPCNIFDIKEKILQLYNQWLIGRLSSNYEGKSIEEYDMKNLSYNLSNLLNGSLKKQ